MDASQVNLSHLSEEECQQILSVIQRDFSLRQHEKDRLEELQAEIKEEKLRSEILSKGRTFNENCCVRCFAQFYMLFNPKVQCVSCKFNVCKKCSVYNSKQKDYMCSMCKKQEELDTLSNSWFYSNVAERFDRFGSADVVRSIHKRKTESDVDSDSGYHPPTSSTFEANGKHRTSAPFRPTLEEPLTTGVDREESVFAHLRERLDVIEENVMKLHHQDNRTEQQKQFYDNSVKQNIDNVQNLLINVSKQLASTGNSADSDDSSSERANREQQETIAKQLLQTAIQQLYSSQSMMHSANNEDPFAFIDPSTLTLDAYTKRLSEAIINKINEDHHQSQRQIGDEVEEEDEEEEEEVEEEEVVVVVNNRMPSVIPQHSDSELVTTDSMSDVDVRDRVSIWQQRSMEMNLSRSESQSLTSLNHSQNEMEMPPSFINSPILTEKLAALNRSEMSRSESRSDHSQNEMEIPPSFINSPLLTEKLNQSEMSRSGSQSLTSLNHSQNEMEIPPSFINSSLLTEKLAVLNQSEMSRSGSQSLTSLNHSQNEMEIPPSFINSPLHTEKLAVLNRSEMPTVISQYSTDPPCQESLVISNRPDSHRRLTSTSSESDVETRTSETINQSKVETLEAVTPGAEQLEDDFAINTYVSDKKFDSADYDVTTDSILAFAIRKRETPALPNLDSDERNIAIKSSDSDLDLTKDLDADKSNYGPWTLGINRRIPMTPHDSLRSKRSADRSGIDSPSIFLPRHLQIEAPFIGDICASELSDTDSLSVSDGGSDADEDDVKPSEQTDKTTSAKHRTRTMSQTDDVRIKSKSSIDCFVQTDEDASYVTSFLQPEEQSMRIDGDSRADSAIDNSSFDFPDSSQGFEPVFTEVPQNVIVCCGQSFKCKATLDGGKSIDVYWFHDAFRLDFDERCTVAHKGRVYSMEVVESTLADDGHYVCIAFNEHGRCCHQFTVSIIDPANFQKAGMSNRLKVSTTGQREKPIPKPEYLSKEIATSTALIPPHFVSLDPMSHAVTSHASISINTMSQDDVSKSTDAMPKTSTVSASQQSEMTPHDALSPHGISPSDNLTASPSDNSTTSTSDNSLGDVLSTTESLDVKSTVSGQELLQSVPVPVAQSRLTTPGLQKTFDDAADTRKDAQQTLHAQNQAPVQVPREKEHLIHLDEVSAAKPSQTDERSSSSLTKDWLLQSDCDEDTTSVSDGKVELSFSFPEFERLYQARILTPDQLKSGRFTPHEAELIQKILSRPQEMEEDTRTGNNLQRNDERLAAFDFSYKDPALKAQFHGRDYLIKDSGKLSDRKQGTKTKSSHQIFATSSTSLSSPHNSYNAVELHHAANSDVMRNHLESSATKDHPDISAASDHLKSSSPMDGRDFSSAGQHQSHQPSSESLHVAKPATHPPSEAEDNTDGKMLGEDASENKTTDLEELSLPSVRSLRLLFNSKPASGDESAFKRNYSLTARDLPNSIIAQQRLSKKGEKPPRLSLLPEPSGEF